MIRFLIFAILSAFELNSIEAKWNYECEKYSSPTFCTVNLMVARDSERSNEFLNANDFKFASSFLMTVDEESIPSNIFTTFPEITHAIIYTDGARGEKGFFDGASKLEFLMLHSNRELIENDELSSLKSLKYLTIGEKIKRIDDNSFWGLNNLIKLDLRYNKLKSINKFMFVGLENLQELYLNSNQIESIDDEAFDFPKLLLLDISGNVLTQVNSDLFMNNPHLVRLNLENNFIEIINFKIPNGLQEFSISNNPIKTNINIIQLIRSLPELEIVKMKNTTSMIQFHTNDDNFTHKKIKHIDISFNNFTDSNIFNYFKNFQKLEHINLGKNRLSALSELGNVKNVFPYLKEVIIKCNVFECNWLESQISNLNVSLTYPSYSEEFYSKCPKWIHTVDKKRDIECM